MSEETRAYSRGYQAGRGYAARGISTDLERWRKEQFRQKAALTVLQQMMLPGNAWGRTVDGQHKPYVTMAEYAKGAFQFADSLLTHTWFSGQIFAPAEESSE